MPILPAAAGDQIMQRIEQLAAISESSDGLTRRFATPEHRRANDLVGEWMRAAGMQVSEDAIGNIIGRYEGENENAPAILLGSHLDTVVMAGKFDGMLGVLVGLACVEHLNATGKRLPQAVEVIGFADEEGVRYQTTFLGSRALAGSFDKSMLSRTDEDGISMHDALQIFGKDPSQLDTAIRVPGSLFAYLEVHIEQGPVLEREQLGVGVVSGIAGATRMVVNIEGEAGHAGTVPMTLRRDALAAAAECITAIERACTGPADLVGTVGRIIAEPGAGNVIPGHVEFAIDIRAAHDDTRLQAVSGVSEALQTICKARSLPITIEQIHNENSVACNRQITEHIEAGIATTGNRVLSLTSGAGHDAMVMAHVTRAGMLFVRCAGGISHNPAESITADDAGLAANALMHAVINVAGQTQAQTP